METPGIGARRSIRRQIVRMAAGVTAVIVAAFSLIGYVQERRNEMSRIDAALKHAAYATVALYGLEFHDRITGPASLPDEDYQESVRRLSMLAQDIGVTYVYTMVQEGNSVFFVTQSATAEELEAGDIESFYQSYDEASSSVHEAFAGTDIVFDEAKDRWGFFRTVLIPFRTGSGRTFVAGADIDMSLVEQAALKVLLRSLGIGLILFFVVSLTAAAVAGRLAAPLVQLSAIIEALINSGLVLDEKRRTQLAALAGGRTYETATLAHSFDLLTKHLQEALNTLRIAKEHVEERVREATQELAGQKEYLSRSISRILCEMGRLAEGDLNARLEVTGDDEISSLSIGFNHAVDRMRHVMSRLSETIERTANITSEVDALTTELSDKARKQSALAQDVHAVVESMVTSIQNSSENAARASHLALENGRVAGEGGEVVRHTTSKIRRIAGTTQTSSESIQRLDETSIRIGEIVDLIHAISEQTHLLALNAAIEAARAGDQGRGFAVVADEVRKLSERTKEATRSVSEMVSSLQDDTSRATGLFEQGMREVSEGLELADRAGEAMNLIVKQARSASETAGHIATMSDRQAEQSRVIFDKVDSISTSSRNAAGDIERVSEAVRVLNDLTRELLDLQSQFQVCTLGRPLETA